MTTKSEIDTKANTSDVYTKKEHNADITTLLFITLGLFGAISFVVFVSQSFIDERLDNIEQVIESPVVEPPNPLDGWVEECANETIIRHYTYITRPDTAPCDGICGGQGRASFHSIGATDIEGYVLDSVWNETVCTKWMWVRYE